MGNNTYRRDGVRLALEGFVVLVSILAAFFLEGWRDDRELALEVDQELVSVRLELGRNLELVHAELGALGRIISASDHLLGRLTDERGAEAVIVPDSLVWLATTWGPTFDVSLGAVDALIASGRLSQVDDHELRLGLAGLRDMFADASEEQTLAQRLTFDRLYPILEERMDLDPIRRVSAEFILSGQRAGAAPQEETTDRAMPTHDMVRFPNGPAVRGVLNTRLVWYEAAIAELRRLPPHLTSLMDQISAEIR